MCDKQKRDDYAWLPTNDEANQLLDYLATQETPRQHLQIKVGVAIKMIGFACLALALLAICLGSVSWFLGFLFAGIILAPLGLVISAIA